MPAKVLIDGSLRDPDDAKVPVLDRGFLYGDSVYEVVRTYDGKPFGLTEHLARLVRSAEALALALPGEQELREGLRRTVEAALAGPDAGREAYARIIVTRGGGEIGLDPALADGPRLVVIAKPLVETDPARYAHGVDVVIVGVRRNPRRAIDPRVKSGNYLNNIMALAEARRAGVYEAVMLDGEGNVTEGSTCNYFLVRDGRLLTPALEVGILEGITRATVLALARAGGMGTDEVRLRPDSLVTADEMFLTSTLRGVLPVTRVEGRPIGSGVPGPVTRRLHERYEAEARARASW